MSTPCSSIGALHALNLVFGQNILAYRLFTVLGSVALASLGYTHVRRDFGWKPGVLFTAFVLFIPYTAIMSTEIRMYSWATFSVMLCALTAWRIACACASQRAKALWPASRNARRGRGFLRERRFRGGFVFAVSSLASAYLHYFGAMSAFMVNLLLLAFCINRAARRRGAAALGVLVASAAIQVALYVPWLLVLVRQMGVVSNTYWANMVFPVTYIEFATYPVRTSFVHFALEGSYGAVPQVVGRVLLAATLVWLCAWAIWSLVRLVKPHVLAGERAEGGSRAATGKAAGREDFRGRAAVGSAGEGSSCSANAPDEGGELPANFAPEPGKPPRPARFAFSALCPLGFARLGCPRALCARDLPGRFRDFLLGFHPDGLAYRVLPLPRGGNRSAPFCGGNASFPHSLARTRRCGMCYLFFRLRPQHDAARRATSTAPTTRRRSTKCVKRSIA